MRTTLRLDDTLMAQAKQREAEEDTTLTALVEDALPRRLGHRDSERRRHCRFPTFGGGGVRLVVDVFDNSALRAHLDEQ